MKPLTWIASLGVVAVTMHACAAASAHSPGEETITLPVRTPYWLDGREPARTIDGRDWAQMSADQRDGFAIGYYDCFVFGKGRMGPTGSRDDWSSGITRFYESDPARLTLPVGQALDHVSKAHPDTSISKRASSYFDGEMWRQMLPASRIQYVQGFMSCHADDMKLPPETVIARYEKVMSDWYGISVTEVDEINPDRVTAKMGDVISSLLAGKKPD